MDKLNLDRIVLKRFGITMGIVSLIISCILFFRCKYNSAILSLGVSLIFFLAGLFVPTLLKYLYIVWMRFAFILAWINTRIILAVIFYVIFTFVGLFMRLLRIDLLERKKKQSTYWKQKDEAFNPLTYERRF